MPVCLPGSGDPFISAMARQDAGERQQPGSEHIMFAVRGKKGGYHFAKCKLCNVLLQAKADYTSHRLGRKHRENVEQFEGGLVG